MTRKRLLALLGLTAAAVIALVLARGSDRQSDSFFSRAGGRPTGGGAAVSSLHGDDWDTHGEREMTLACAIEGTVEDERGVVVGGALVTVRRARSGPPFRGGLSHRTNADLDGAFRIDVECAEHEVTATAPGRVSPRAEEVEVTDVSTVRLVLSREGYALSGAITDRNGGVVPMATISATRFPGGGSWSVATDAEGHYRLLLPMASYFVEASAADYAAVRRQVTVNRERTADFRLDPAGTMRGRVVLADTGESVPGALVRARTGRRFRGHIATSNTDADGAFELGGLAAGEWDVEASRGRLRGRYPGHVPVNVASYTPDIVIAVKPGLAIRGFVRDQSGVGVPDAMVQWFMGRGRGRSEETHTHTDGSFVIAGLEAGRGMLLAQHDDYVPATEPMEVGGDVDGVEIVLASGARVRGVVVNQRDRPVSGAMVSARSEGGGRRGRRMMRMMLAAGSRDITDGDGEFELEGIAEGDLSIRAQHLDGGLATDTLKGVEAGREYNVRMVMAQGATVSGTVIWTDGQPAAGATVHAFSRALGPMGAAETEVTDTGSYVLKGLDAHAYRLWVLRPGVELAMPLPTADSPQLDVELEPEQQLTDIDFQLPLANQSIAGAVVDEAGGPVGDAEVGADHASTGGMLGRFRPHMSSGQTTRSSADGTFLLDQLVAGTYVVWAELPGFPRAKVEAIEAGATDVVIRIPPGAVLAGTVVDGDGTPVPAYQLRTVPAFESAGWSRWRGADRITIDNEGGDFEVRGLRAGFYRLVATSSSGQLAELEVEVGEGERRDGLLLRSSGGTTLVGTLTSHPSNNPVSCDVHLVTDGGRKRSTCEDGRFEVEGLVTGRAMLIARVDPGAFVPDHFSVTLADGANEVGLRLVEVAALAPGASTPGLEFQLVMGRVVMSAATAGIAAGDELLTIDGVPLAGFGSNGVAALLRGPAGSSVSLGLRNAASGEAFTVVVVRTDS